MRTVTRLAARVAMLVALLVVVVALALGSAAGPLSMVLGRLPHVCGCGMVPGKCGCAACERLERERHRDRLGGSRSRPVLKASCEDGSAALGSAPLAPCVVPQVFTVGDCCFEVPRPSKALGRWPSLAGKEPPTPPPRTRTV